MNIHPSHEIERVDAVGQCKQCRAAFVGEQFEPRIEWQCRDTCDNVVGSDQPSPCGRLATVAVPARVSARGHFCAYCAGLNIAALYEAAGRVRIALKELSTQLGPENRGRVAAVESILNSAC